jgi:hypothetical protein
MLAVRNSANGRVMLGAAISGVNHNRRACLRPQLFQPIQQSRIDLQAPATATLQLAPRKMRTQISHSSHSSEKLLT